MKGYARTTPGFIENLINSGKIAPSPEHITVPVTLNNVGGKGELLYGMISFPTEVIIEHLEIYVESVYSDYILGVSAKAFLDVPGSDFTYLPKFDSTTSSLKDYFKNKKITGIAFESSAPGIMEPNVDVYLQITYYKFIN